MTRKDIAHYSGVTPALVTYYYPEKDSLIEVATLPIVDTMVAGVEKCLTAAKPLQERLLEAIGLMIEFYARDAAIIDLFTAYRASKADTLPDVLGRMDDALQRFFDQWLKQDNNSVYDAAYLRKAATGMCKIVARGPSSGLAYDSRGEARRIRPAEAICSILLRPVARGEMVEPSALEMGSGPRGM